ncbi:MAG: phosphoribosyltransferase family protein [Pseudomonadota bacterium]
MPARSALTPEDFGALYFITGSICARCGGPQTLDLGQDDICAVCHGSKTAWKKVRAALVYDDVSRSPILALKRAGRRDGLQLMATWMAVAGADLLSNADLIVPIPLHYRRLVSRGYNQAGWLATALARQTGKPVRHGALTRTRSTPSQAGRSARERFRNVRGAFRVRRSGKQHITGQRILLVDDVFTTGATANAAARALLAANAAEVSILVLARVAREKDVTI